MAINKRNSSECNLPRSSRFLDHMFIKARAIEKINNRYNESFKMRLYGFSGAFSSAFFDTEEELIEYVKTSDTAFGNLCVIDYLGTVANRSDVIRVTYKDNEPRLYTAVDENGYGIYNKERSIYEGKDVWEYSYGSIREMYSAFRERGIAFENDIYAKIDENQRKLYEMLSGHRNDPVLTKKK